MSTTLTSAAIAERLGRELVKALRRDRANRYTLSADWTLPPLVDPPPDYSGPLIRIKDGVVTVRQYTGDTCDGATLAPDQIGPWKPVIAAIFHDPWYIEMPALAAHWDWPQKRVRLLGDRIFYGILARICPGILARSYYRFVRLFGGIAHFCGTVASILILAVLIGGCAGCTAPIDPFDPDQPLTIPDYTKTAHRSPPPDHLPPPT